MEESTEITSRNSDNEIEFTSKKVVRKSALVLSSDEDESSANDFHTLEPPKDSPSDSGVEDNSTAGSVEKKKISRVKRFSSSSESEDEHKSDKDESSHDSFKFPHLDSQDSITNKTNDETSPNGDEDCSSPGKSCDKSSKQKDYNKMFSDDIYDAEGSSDEDIRTSQQSPVRSPSPQIKKKIKTSKEKLEKNSKKPKSNTSELDEIHRESQRMIRESRVSLPYHIPKQRSLQDFLNRNKSIPKVSLKSTSQDLSLVWKHLEECEKTAETFYKSESEESEKEEEKEEKLCVKGPAEQTSLEVGVSSKECETKNKLGSSEIISEISNLMDGSVKEAAEDLNSFHVNKPDDDALENLEETLLDNKKDCDTKENTTLPDDEADSKRKCDFSIKKKDGKPEDMECEFSDSENTFFGVEIDFEGALKSDEEEESEQIKDHIKSGEEKFEIKSKSDHVTDIKLNDNSLSDKVNESVDKCGENQTHNSSGENKEEFSSENLTKSLIKSLDSTFVKVQSSLSLLCDTSVLDKVPKLSCGPGDEIDLDEPVGGVSKLLERFIKHSKLKTVVKEEKSVKLNVLNVETDEGGEITALNEEEIVVSTKEEKPGQKLCALKQTLKKSIEVSRSQHLAKRIEQYKMYEQEFYEDVGGKPDNEDEKDDFDEIFDEGKLSGESSEEESDEIEDDVNLSDKPRTKSDLLDDEAEESEIENKESDEEGSDAEGNDEKGARKSLNFDDTDKLDLSGLGLQTQFDNDGDLLGLCSGKFQTQPVSLSQLEDEDNLKFNTSVNLDQSQEKDYSQEIFSQKSIKPNNMTDSDEDIDNTEENSNDAGDDEIEPLESGSQGNELSNKKQISKILDSDEECDVNVVQNKTQIKRLQFSDDEEDDESKNDDKIQENVNGRNNISDSSGDELEADDDAVSESGEVNDINDDIEQEPKVIHYDSEEEIVEGQGHKFLEVEAELSGSEWGSEDEDEKGLSDFEADDADMEKINQRKLKSELERLHMAEVLADDKREIRLLQELLLEDGDLHSDGPKRQRLYRWSNQDGFDNAGKMALSDDEGGGGVDEEEEELLWRKQRQERENFLNSTRLKEDDNEHENSIALPVTDKKTKQTKQVQSILTSPDPKQPFRLLTNRGSFLGRSEKVLTKLAELSGPTEQQQNRVKRNMVFSVVSPPKPSCDNSTQQDNEKRKADENLPRVTKKLKFNQNNKNSRSIGLLQKLMESDANT